MRLRTIFREALLNITTGSTRLALFASVLAVLIAALGGAEIATIASIDEQAIRFRDSGGSTLIYRMDAEINGPACDRLRELPGVSAAGAVRRRGTGEIPLALPDQQIPTFDISPAFGGFQALGRPHVGDGVIISEDVAQTLGVSRGQRLPLTEAQPRISAVFTYPADGRQPGYGYAILSPTDTRTAFDECWVESWPVGDDLIAILPTTLLPGAAGDPKSGVPGPRLQQLNASHGTRFEGAQLFADRITRFAPATAVLAGIALGFVATIRRKLELAAARHARVASPAQALHILVETSAWTWVGIVLALAPLAILIAYADASATEALQLFAVRVAIATVPATLIGALAAVLTIKERHLFRYFTSR